MGRFETNRGTLKYRTEKQRSESKFVLPSFLLAWLRMSNREKINKSINTPNVPNQNITSTYNYTSTPLHKFSLTALASLNGNAHTNIELTVCSCSRFCFLSVAGDFKPWAATLLFDIMLIDLYQVPRASHSCSTCGRPSTPLTIVTRHKATIVCYEGINMIWLRHGYFRLYLV